MPIHCNQTIATCYKEARQKPGQGVTDFVAYLDRLEDELSLYDDKARLRHLKTKLWPKITDKIIAWPNHLKTRQKAIDLAVWLEQVKSFCKLKTTTTQRSDAPTRLCGCGCKYGGYFYRPLRNNMMEISSTNQTPLNATIMADKKEKR